MRQGGKLTLPLVGRDGELSQLSATLESAVAGIVIFGAAGVGKTRLAAEFAAQAEADGATVVRAAATRSTKDLPFGAFASILGEGVVATAASPDARYEVLSAGVEHLRATYGPERFILVIDDAHLLDNGSAALVYHLVQAGQAFVVASVREGETVPDAIEALWRDEITDRVELAPLTDADVSRLCAAALGGRVDTPTRRRLFASSGGNLLYLRELLLAGLQSGALARRDDVWSWRGPLAPGNRLSHLIAARLESAGPAVRRVLELVAVGDTVEFDVLTTLVPPDAVEQAEAGGYLTISRDGLRTATQLAHPLFGEVLRDAMPEVTRRRLAGALADELSARGARRHSDVLRQAALDLAAGRSHQADRLLAASIQARRLGDLALSERFARAAIDAGAGAAATVELEECLAWQGRFLEVAEMPQLVSTDLPGPVLAHAARNRASALFFGRGDFAAADAVLVQAEEQLGSDPLAAGARSHRAELAMFSGQLEPAARLAREVLASGGAPAVARASAYGALAPILALAGRADDAAAVADEGLAFVLAQPEPPLWEGAGIVVGQFLAALLGGRLGESEPMVAALYAEAAGRPLDPMRGVWALMLGRTAAASGELYVAHERLTEAAGLLRQYDPGRVLAWCLGSLAQAEGQRGDARAARVAVEEMEIERNPMIRVFDVDLELGRAWAATANGASTEGRQIALDASTAALACGAFGAAGYALHEAFRLGARDTAAAWALIEVQCQGELPGAAAGMARADRAADALVAAAEAFAGCGMHLWSAEAAAMAEVHARDAAPDVRAAARARRDEELAHCEGRRTPLLRWATDRSTAEALSARELEVARLAASGRTNAEIGERLGVSRRTVENHLAHVFRKLEISSRTELVEHISPPPTAEDPAPPLN